MMFGENEIETECNSSTNHNHTTEHITKCAKVYVDELLSAADRIPIDKDVAYKIELPIWYDEKLFKRAQTFFKRNIFACFSGMLAGLIAILAVPSILNVLIFTNQSSKPFTAYRRYVQTIFHMLNWYTKDASPETKYWKSVEYVRKIHLTSSRAAEKNDAGIISQKDMAITQFGFIGFVMVKGKLLGVQGTREDYEALSHFWRVLGHMLGIEDRFNLCTGSLEQSIAKMEAVMASILRPQLHNSRPEFEQMSEALIEGLWCFNPLLTYKSFMFFTRRLAEVPGHEYFANENYSGSSVKLSNTETGCPVDAIKPVYKTINWFHRTILLYMILIKQFLLRFYLVRAYFNGQMWLSRFLIYYFPFLAFFKFGIQKSYVRILRGCKNS